jgi:hypothetical protein
MTDVDLHIDRLVVDSALVAPGDRHALGAAVELELGRLLAEGGLSPTLAAGGDVATVRTPAIQLSSSDPASIGTGIARAVHGGLTSE